MVEYAILLVVLVLLVAGGLELAIAAYNGHAAREAARAGAEQWLETLAAATCSGGVCTLAGGGLGDHPDSSDDFGDDNAELNFRRPSCPSATDYDDGLPDGSVAAAERGTTQGGDKIYLYNPLPLDISGCSGTDADYPHRSRVSVLVSGKPDDPNTPADESFAGLPQLNQAIYAHYEKTFIDMSTGSFIPIRDYDPGNPNHARLLSLPGWLDATDDYAMSRLVRLDAAGNVTSKPAFAIECAPQGSDAWGLCDSAGAPLGICWDAASIPSTTALACNVRVQYRYRHVFESLVMMGVGTGYDALTDSNPVVENVDAGDEGFFASDAAGAGLLGSELALTKRTDARALASRLKARMDFLGCYATTFQDNGSAVVSASARNSGDCEYPRLSHP